LGASKPTRSPVETSHELRKHGSTEARKHGSTEARKHGSTEARKHGSDHFRRIAVFAFGVTVVAVPACKPDLLTSTNRAAVTSAAQSSRAPSAEQPRIRKGISREQALTDRIPSRDSVNQCFVTEIDRDLAKPRTTHSTIRLRDPSETEKRAAGPGKVSASRDTSATSIFYLIRFDATGKTTTRVNCVIPNTEAAFAAAVNRFSRDGYKGPKPLHPPAEPSSSARDPGGVPVESETVSYTNSPIGGYYNGDESGVDQPSLNFHGAQLT
jgi:hypothetical protein